MEANELLYQIALTQISGVGDVIAKNLVAYCGSASGIFSAKRANLVKIPMVGEIVAQSVIKTRQDMAIFKRAEAEIKFIEDEKITPLFFTDKNYPAKLRHCKDGPAILFYKGNADLNKQKVISVIGTRNATEYGKIQTEKLLADLKGEDILIVSGLAYGIDTYAHRNALSSDLETIAVLAHGLDDIYPPANAALSKKIMKQGGLLTEFLSLTNPDKENFPKRNRIVAGMCDAVIVVESKKKGGALITAEIANSYSRDVFAFPGRAGDLHSEGCNMFIKRNKAALIENAADLLYAMNWEKKEEKKKNNKQIPLLVNLSDDENKIVSFLKEKQTQHIDEICNALELTPGKASGLLLQLEFSNIVKPLPGKLYTLI